MNLPDKLSMWEIFDYEWEIKSLKVIRTSSSFYLFVFFSGGYALVFIAYDLKTNKEYALKVLFDRNRSSFEFHFRDYSLQMTVQKKRLLKKFPFS